MEKEAAEKVDWICCPKSLISPHGTKAVEIPLAANTKYAKLNDLDKSG